MRSTNHRAPIAAANRVGQKNRLTQTLTGIILLTTFAGILSSCGKENNPKPPAGKEDFIVAGVPDAKDKPLYFAVRTFDDSGNRSGISNVSRLE